MAVYLLGRREWKREYNRCDIGEIETRSGVVHTPAIQSRKRARWRSQLFRQHPWRLSDYLHISFSKHMRSLSTQLRMQQILTDPERPAQLARFIVHRRHRN